MATSFLTAHRVTPKRRRRSETYVNLQRALRTRGGAIGLGLLLLIVALAAVGPLFAPYSPTRSLTVPFSKASSTYALGSDVLGRDVLSRLLAGGRTLLLMAVAATALGVLLGAAAGISAAYLRGRRDGLIMRAVDVILAFPQLIFALLIVSIAGPKLWLIVIAVGFSHAPAVARVLRSATLDVTERDFVKVVELQGLSARRVMTGEILPNIVSPLMVEIGLRLTYSIMIIAGLAFLGLGQPPPAANWGLMISENLVGVQANPWAVIAPVAAIALLTIGTNLFTDAYARVAIGADRPTETRALLTDLGQSGDSNVER